MYQGTSFNYTFDTTLCGNVPSCNYNNVVAVSPNPFYYGYLQFFLCALAIAVGCPVLGWLWSKGTRDKKYKPAGGY